MAVTMKDLGIDKLSVDDRLDLLQEIWCSVSENFDPATISKEDEHLITQRLANLDAHPENVLTWEEIQCRIQGERQA